VKGTEPRAAQFKRQGKPESLYPKLNWTFRSGRVELKGQQMSIATSSFLAFSESHTHGTTSQPRGLLFSHEIRQVPGRPDISRSPRGSASVARSGWIVAGPA
jgi:hypothetical protein